MARLLPILCLKLDKICRNMGVTFGFVSILNFGVDEKS